MGELRHRERVNLSLDRELIKKLRQKSAETMVPLSRLIEIAIKEKYDQN